MWGIVVVLMACFAPPASAGEVEVVKECGDDGCRTTYVPKEEREFWVAGAEVDFSVEKDDGRFEIEVDIDDARPGSKWRVVLRHDGRRIHQRVHRTDSDGDIEFDKSRRNTKGGDTFKVRVKRIGGGAKSRVIRMR